MYFLNQNHQLFTSTTHSFTHSLTHPLTHPLTHTPTHIHMTLSITTDLIHLLLTHPPIHSHLPPYPTQNHQLNSIGQSIALISNLQPHPNCHPLSSSRMADHRSFLWLTTAVLGPQWSVASGP